MKTIGEPILPPPSPRDAASLLLVRAHPEGADVLMARRGPGHRFMPGVLVFPGGAVDASDFTAPVGSPLRPHVQADLEKSASPALAQALAVAAARELAEEVGLSMGEPPLLHNLDYLCRAITPPDRAIRFDARFFVIDAAHITGTPTASTEMDHPAWYRIDEQLAASLVQPTKSILLRLQEWRTRMPGGARTRKIPVLRNRVWEDED